MFLVKTLEFAVPLIISDPLFGFIFKNLYSRSKTLLLLTAMT